MLGRIKRVATIIAGLALFGFVIFQIGVASNHQKRESPPREDRGENANANQEKTSDRSKGSSAIDIECDPNCSAKHPYENRNESYFSRMLRKTSDDPLTILTGVLALATFGLVFGVVIQVRDGRRSAERQLRAYLMIRDVKFARPKLPDGDSRPWHIHVVFNNFGKTPAYSTVYQVERGLRKNPPAELELKLTSEATITAPTVMPPGHIYTIRLGGLDGGLADFVAARQSGQVCFVWGRVDYIDTFGDHHFTTFQMACNFGQLHQFGFCQNGNGTDDRFRRWRDWWKSPMVLKPTIGTEGEKPIT